jgi:hypothetical protein
MLQKRHTHWVNIWNANCDSDTPRSKRELLTELNSWERSQNSNKSPNPVSKKDFDVDHWSKGHNDQFKSLIAQARRAKMAAKVEKPAEEPAILASSATVEGDGGITQRFKQVSQVVSEDTDDSLYRGRTPPTIHSISSTTSEDGNRRIGVEPVQDAQMGNI